ncbi:response regulator [Flavobacterium lacustre]|uniref:response regulator n=1 Tax=Flavobacterium lacustre TaxID=3016339 RepID=UPI0022B6B77C|nr:response regulator [Flavobacterium lacustre]
MFDKILFVDDDPITLMLCKKVIAKSSFANEIATAQDGEEALKYFNTLKYDNTKKITDKIPQLIFLDLNMPIMGGWEFLDHFTSDAYAEFSETKVIILSSTIDPEDLERAKKHPVIIDFLSKPITTSMLEYLKSKLL